MKIFEKRVDGVVTERQYHPETKEEHALLSEQHPGIGPNFRYVTVAVRPPEPVAYAPCAPFYGSTIYSAGTYLYEVR